MARKKAKDKQGMTVYPPAEVAATLGAFNTTALTQALRVASQILGAAAEDVAAMPFSPAEWAQLAGALESRVIEPEVPNPGPVLADLVEQAASRFGAQQTPAPAAPSSAAHHGGEQGAARPHRGGGGSNSNNGSLAERLRGLCYAQAWAILIAVRFRRDNAEALPEGARWWEVPVRWRLLCQEAEYQS